jgi:hypothetical protein
MPSAPPVVEPSAAPRCLQSLLIRVGGAAYVYVSLVVGGGHDPSPAIAEVGESAPEHVGERAAAAAGDQSGAAPESAGSKRTAPEQGSSGRPVKKSQVRSKM